MFTAIAFLFIVFVYMPIRLIIDAASGSLIPGNKEIHEHNRRVKYEDKMDNDYGYIVTKKNK